MEIGIMSMQRVVNYGSFLQAYGLKKTIESMGHIVRFVDYKAEPSLVKDDENLKAESSGNVMKRAIRMLSSDYRRYRKQQIKMNQTFSEFCKAYNESFLPKLGVNSESNFIPEVDVLVIGSDEVFNCTQSGDLVGYSLQLFGKDNRAKKLISYAASFGSTTMEKLEKYSVLDEIGHYLNGFNAISVRDTNSKGIVESLCGFCPEQHIDPVLLYEFPEVEAIDISMKDYIVVYAYADRIKDEEAEEIRKFAKEKEKKILCLGFYQPFCDEYILATPLEVLAYIKNADYVITDTFHGTVFSIKYQIPFATIIRESNKQKLEDLLTLFQLEKRQILQLNQLKTILNCQINREDISDKINSERMAAKKYLEKILL